jgi:hypothetical protein
VEHNKDVAFNALINQKQLKHLWLPFDINIVKQRIQLEWDIHYRALLLNVPYIVQPIQDLPAPCSPIHETELEDPLPPDSGTIVDSPLSPFPNNVLPEPYPDSRQEPGEWWYDHYSQVKLCEELGDDDETPLELKRRDARIKAAKGSRSKRHVPHDFTDLVFVWEPTDVHPTFLLRR